MATSAQSIRENARNLRNERRFRKDLPNERMVCAGTLCKQQAAEGYASGITPGRRFDFDPRLSEIEETLKSGAERTKRMTSAR